LISRTNIKSSVHNPSLIRFNFKTSTLRTRWQVNPGTAEGFPAWLVPLNVTGAHFGVGDLHVAFELDPTQVRDNPSQGCVNRSQGCVNRSQGCVNPTQGCVNPARGG
jgi:hypothetical protein